MIGSSAMIVPMISLVAVLHLVSSSSLPPSAGEGGGQAMALKVQSSAFTEGSTIPAKHTCDGADVSPAVSWSGVPAEAKSLALICHDPDAPAGDWVHWVLFDLPSSLTQLPEGVPKEAELKGGGRQGMNDFSRIGYNGPCPPRGPAHRYYFTLYALDKMLGLPAKATRDEVLRATKGHVLAETQLMGRYARGSAR